MSGKAKWPEALGSAVGSLAWGAAFILVVVKLAGAQWSGWWVLAPLGGLLALVAVLYAIVFIGLLWVSIKEAVVERRGYRKALREAEGRKT